jgi:hypothetical protein
LGEANRQFLPHLWSSPSRERKNVKYLYTSLKLSSRARQGRAWRSQLLEFKIFHLAEFAQLCLFKWELRLLSQRECSAIALQVRNDKNIFVGELVDRAAHPWGVAQHPLVEDEHGW